MAVVKLEDAPVTLESLKHSLAVITLESQNPSQILKALPHKLPAFVADVKNFISNIANLKESVAPGVIDTRDMEKLIPKQNYVVLSDVTVFVPPSMNVEYDQFIDALASSQLVIERLMPETLVPSLRWIASVLTQPENLSSLRSKTGEFGIVFHDIEAEKKKIAACYAKAGSESKVRYGDVFKRNADFLIALKRINDISEALAKINRQEVVDLVNQITDAMDKLLVRTQQYPDQYKMTGATMRDLSTLAYNLGTEIEFFAAHSYLVQSAAQALKDSKEKMDDVLKR